MLRYSWLPDLRVPLACRALEFVRQCQYVCVPLMDLVDETFIAVPPAFLRVELDDPQRWRSWWPELALTMFMDRDDQGIRWSVQGYPHRDS